ncbi:hypothetical protein Daus18300_011057 [Diaporthe australafricana]|uniref:Uncharacterized protein n=1 Tax=Diaporthe australafricana TaxID=127596 RepID=A0ABR3W8M3_9PEZI
MAEKVQYDVYLGAWTNWSRGRILGATLTLESRYGLLLLSFTATFVGFVASRFWRIITLILHRIYSTPEPRDALHHQRQVVLRNSLSSVSTLWTSLQLVWCWWAVADGYLARTLPVIIFAASAFCAFTIAGGFTSSISSGIGNDVLINSSHCGVILYDESLTSDAVAVIYSWVSQTMSNAANYAQQCYSSSATGTLDCTTFVESRLHFNIVINASCPFSENMCRTNDSNLLLDSGLISSDDLGLNLPRDQRMFYREVLECAPLRTDGFVSDVSMNNNNYTRYSYGGRMNRGRTDDGAEFYDWTYEVESLDAQYRRQSDDTLRETNQGFNLMALESIIANGTTDGRVGRGDFVAIPQLGLPDADLLVAFLSPEGIFFMNQTDDLWYRGIVPNGSLYFSTGQRAVYMSDEAASPMGCLQRFQYCNSNKKCGSLASSADSLTSALPLFHQTPADFWSGESSQEPDATASRFNMFQATLTSSTTLFTLINCLGASSLLSSQRLNQGVMGPLPDNQWQLDVTHWFAIRMASLQAAFVNTARGPADEAVLPYLMTPGDDEYQRTMCNNQKILSTGYTSLSLFGLYFTYAAGIIIILASYVVEPLLTLFYSRRKYKEYKYLEWAANSTLQLQRLAYQGLGSEKWTNYTDDIPKTRPGYFLADLARAYPPGDEDNEIREVKPTTHATTTTTPSVSEASVNQGVSEQSQGAPPRPISAVSSELIPQAVSPISQPSRL